MSAPLQRTSVGDSRFLVGVKETFNKHVIPFVTVGTVMVGISLAASTMIGLETTHALAMSAIGLISQTVFSKYDTTGNMRNLKAWLIIDLLSTSACIFAGFSPISSLALLGINSISRILIDNAQYLAMVIKKKNLNVATDDKRFLRAVHFKKTRTWIVLSTISNGVVSYGVAYLCNLNPVVASICALAACLHKHAISNYNYSPGLVSTDRIAFLNQLDIVTVALTTAAIGNISVVHFLAIFKIARISFNLSKIIGSEIQNHNRAKKASPAGK